MTWINLFIQDLVKSCQIYYNHEYFSNDIRNDFYQYICNNTFENIIDKYNINSNAEYYIKENVERDLNDSQRQLFKFYYVENINITKIANELNSNSYRIKRRISTILKKLINYLPKYLLSTAEYNRMIYLDSCPLLNRYKDNYNIKFVELELPKNIQVAIFRYLLLNIRLTVPINRVTVRDVILNIDDISKISGLGVKKLAIIFDTFESLNLDIRRWKMTISISKLKEINYYRKTI